LKAKTNFCYTKDQLVRILANCEDLVESDLNTYELDETLEM